MEAIPLTAKAYKIVVSGRLSIEARKAIRDSWHAEWNRTGVTPPPVFLCEHGTDIVPLDPSDIPAPTPAPIAVHFREST